MIKIGDDGCVEELLDDPELFRKVTIEEKREWHLKNIRRTLVQIEQLYDHIEKHKRALDRIADKK